MPRVSLKARLSAINWYDKLVDVFVVILGVTAAFALNNWQQNSAETRLKKRYLLSLKNDLINDVHDLGEAINKIDTLMHGTSRVIAYSNSEPVPEDSMGIYLNMVFTLSDFDPKVNTYTALQNTGNFTLFEDMELAGKIVELYNGEYNSIQTIDEVSMQHFQQALLPVFVQYADIRKSNFIDGNYAKTRNFTNLAVIVLQYRQQIRKAYVKAKQSAEDLIQLIDKESDK